MRPLTSRGTKSAPSPPVMRRAVLPAIRYVVARIAEHLGRAGAGLDHVIAVGAALHARADHLRDPDCPRVKDELRDAAFRLRGDEQHDLPVDHH